jgi:predicted RNA-binding protein associated with RNAse of E/G family
MLQRPGDAYAAWVFWEGPDRHFDSWYINMQEPFRRSELGYDTQDLELDIVVFPDLSWELKDDDVLDERIFQGRYTVEQVRETREEASRLTALIDAGNLWWSESWATWKPDPSWPLPAFPNDWSRAH